MLLSHTQAQIPFKLPLQLKWRRGPDMPFVMTGYIQSVRVQGTVYVGGGGAGHDGENRFVIMAYDISSSTWSTLPPYRLWQFAMTVIHNELVLVGGENRDEASEKVLAVWSAESKTWTHPYPDMREARFLCSASVYKQWLIVVGGWGGQWSKYTSSAENLLTIKSVSTAKKLSSVEILNSDTKQWYVGPKTPTEFTYMRTAIVSDVCYFMGGAIERYNSTKVFSVSLPTLISLTNSDSPNSQIWKEIPELPVREAMPLSINGSLLAVGGRGKDGVSSTVLLYKPGAEQWVKFSDIPTPRYNCNCAITADKELLVAGGKHYYRMTSMDIAQII